MHFAIDTVVSAATNAILTRTIVINSVFLHLLTALWRLQITWKEEKYEICIRKVILIRKEEENTGISDKNSARTEEKKNRQFASKQ